MRYFEDIEEGEVHEFGSHTVRKEEMTEFAEQFDPQPFHVDEEAAGESMFEGLIASGWHTASLCMRMVVDEYLSESASAGARGVRELRWKQPVRPGDTLSIRFEVLETEPDAGNPNLGNVVTHTTGIVDDETEVIEWLSDAMFYRRQAKQLE